MILFFPSSLPPFPFLSLHLSSPKGEFAGAKYSTGCSPPELLYLDGDGQARVLSSPSYHIMPHRTVHLLTSSIQMSTLSPPSLHLSLFFSYFPLLCHRFDPSPLSPSLLRRFTVTIHSWQQILQSIYGRWVSCSSYFAQVGVYLSVWLPVCQAVYLSVVLSVCLAACLSGSISVYQHVCLSVYLSVWLSVYQAVYLSAHLFIYLFV